MQSSRLQPTGCRPRPATRSNPFYRPCTTPIFRPGASGPAPGPAQAKLRLLVPQAQPQSGCLQAAKPNLDLATSSRRPPFTSLCNGALSTVAKCTSTIFGFISKTVRHHSGASLVCHASSESAPASEPEAAVQRLVDQPRSEASAQQGELAAVSTEIGVLKAEIEVAKAATPRNDGLYAALLNMLAALQIKENQLREAAKGAAGRQRRPVSDVDNRFAQQLFRPFPPDTVPRQLVLQRLQELLQTPPAIQLYDPEDILCHTAALQLLFTNCITKDAGDEGVVDLSDAVAGEVYYYLRHVAKMPLKPATATDVAWAGWWAEVSEAVVSIAQVHARVPVSSDRGVVESTLTVEGVTRDQVVWLDSVVLLTGNASGPTHPLSAEEAAAQHEGANAALYGELGWVVHYQASGSRIQLYVMPSDGGGICYPLTDILDVSLPSPRAALLLVLLNLMRLAATIAKEQWLPAAPGMQLYKPILRPSPYPAPADVAAPGYTIGKLVQVTVRKQAVVKEYQAPGWALQQNLRVYEAIQEGRIPHTVKVVSLMVDDEAHETWRQYAKDAWFHVRIVMSPAAYQRNPETPAELWELLRHLLELLVALHREGLVHRDLRLPNVYRFGDSWLVSDWELAAPAGLQVPYKIKRLPEDVKSGREVYTYRHDLWQVAEIIKELRKPAASSLRNCAAAAAFAKLLVEPQMKADRALEDLNRFKHEWS